MNAGRSRVLWLSTVAFTLLFAVWLMLGMLALKLKPDLSLTDAQLYNLTIAAILAGSLLRFHFGVWTDQFGGRRVMTFLLLLTVIPTFLVSRVTSYYELLGCACLYGIAGNAFSVGIAWNAAWWPREKQGFALGVFGAGNVGASVTKLVGPFLIAALPAAGMLGGAIPGGWRFIPVAYSVLLVVMAAAVWFLAPKEDRRPGAGRTILQMAAPAKHAKVWEFSLQYVVVFGAYVALSGILPTYYLNNYGAEISKMLNLDATLVDNFKAINALKGEAYTAYMAANPIVKNDLSSLMIAIGLLASFAYIFPASLLRPLGGILSDKYGARIVMGSVFVAMIAAGVMVSLPLSVTAFTLALFALGCGMGIGKASVYKMIPDAFPNEVGAVGGLVGLLGALGGVLLPLAWTAVPGSTFTALLGLTLISAAWFAVSTLMASRATKPELEAVEA